jgi:hypothetical protein
MEEDKKRHLKVKNITKEFTRNRRVRKNSMVKEVQR